MFFLCLNTTHTSNSHKQNLMLFQDVGLGIYLHKCDRVIVSYSQRLYCNSTSDESPLSKSSFSKTNAYELISAFKNIAIELTDH